MAATTPLLGLVTPTQGTLSGTWGDTVNYGITDYVDISIAGTLSFAGDGAITLANTTGSASGNNIGSTTAQYMVIRVTGTLTTPKIITAPSYSKLYMVDNAATGSTVSFIRSGQVTAVSIAAGESCFVYYNGTDYIKITSDLILGGYTTTATAGTTTTLTAASTTTQFFTGTLTQTITLPVASTLVLGAAFSIHNNSTGSLTVNSSGANLVATITANTTCLFTCILTSGTDAASWDADFTGFTSVLPVARGGTNASSASITAFNNITGYTASGATGTTSTNLVFSTSPTLVTPALGTPSSGTLSSCTVDGTNGVGYLNIPQNSQSAAYTTVLADSGKCIFHPSTDANARTFTIAANASVPYAIGTVIQFCNMTSQVVTIAINSDTMYLAGTGTTGSRSLAIYGVANAMKMTSTTWIITGSGLT